MKEFSFDHRMSPCLPASSINERTHHAECNTQTITSRGYTICGNDEEELVYRRQRAYQRQSRSAFQLLAWSPSPTGHRSHRIERNGGLFLQFQRYHPLVNLDCSVAARTFDTLTVLPPPESARASFNSKQNELTPKVPEPFHPMSPLSRIEPLPRQRAKPTSL